MKLQPIKNATLTEGGMNEVKKQNKEICYLMVWYSVQYILTEPSNRNNQKIK